MSFFNYTLFEMASLKLCICGLWKSKTKLFVGDFHIMAK